MKVFRGRGTQENKTHLSGCGKNWQGEAGTETEGPVWVKGEKGLG